MKKTKPEILKAAYASVFKGDMGRIVMNDLKKWCHITDTSFSPDKPDITAFNEGKRFIYLRIVQMSKLNLDQIMQKEAESDTR